MKSIFRNLNAILNKKQKNYLILLVIFSIILGLVETISIGSLAGFIIFISEPEMISQKIPLPIIKDFIAPIVAQLCYCKDKFLFRRLNIF